MSAEGLRERKKRRTRASIAAAAMELFRAHGFDAVTVADVARAADVSEKTVFNYFPAKEDLLFAVRTERRVALQDAVRERAPGTSIVEPFRAATAAFIDRVEREPVDEVLAVPRMLLASKALRERLFLDWEQEAALLAPVVAEAAGEPEDSISAGAAARALAWTHRLVLKTGHRRLMAGEDPATVAADLRAEAQRAYDLLEGGLGGYGWRDGRP
jgi:AcrR family transcriptional regulator